MHTVQKALPLLNDGASVILTGSTTADRGRAGLSIYAATKAAVRSLARAWANELADRNIRVNVIVAGSTATPGSDRLAAQTDPEASIEEFRAGRIATIPLGRFADPIEIANAAVFWRAICPASPRDPRLPPTVDSTKSDAERAAAPAVPTTAWS